MAETDEDRWSSDGGQDQAEKKPTSKKAEAVKCDNHPDRDAQTFDKGFAPIHLCEECTPPWFND